jgi:hypothetical protein
VVDHFKEKVKYWEIWNEPDEPEYWMPQDDMRTYTELLKKVYPALKRRDPTCKVLMGGVSNMINISLNRIYRNGGKEYFDIVNIHPFANPDSCPTGIETVCGIYKGVRSIMEKYGDSDKKIWFTEIGCPGVARPDRRLGWWHGIGCDETKQAKWVRQVYTDCIRWEGVEKVFWAFFRDTDEFFKSAVDYFGLVRKDFSKKPSYYAYKECALRWKKDTISSQPTSKSTSEQKSAR